MDFSLSPYMSDHLGGSWETNLSRNKGRNGIYKNSHHFLMSPYQVMLITLLLSINNLVNSTLLRWDRNEEQLQDPIIIQESMK